MIKPWERCANMAATAAAWLASACFFIGWLTAGAVLMLAFGTWAIFFLVRTDRAMKKTIAEADEYRRLREDGPAPE